METSKGISRRSFIGGGMAGAAGLVAAGLLSSCSPGSQATTEQSATEGEAAQIKTADETVESNILIVGSGAAGLMAAYEAGKAGAENILVIANCPSIEANNGNMVSGTAAVETPYTEAAGQDYSIEQLFDRMVNFAHWTVNARLLKTCVELLPGNIDIFDELGIELTLGADRYSIGFEEVHLFGTENKSAVFQKHLEDAYGVQFRFSTEAKHALMEDGACVGVQAEDEDGKVIDFKAKATLLACGGYIDNPDMLKEVYGDMTIVASSTEWQKGLGVKIAQEAGAFRESTHGLGMNDIFGSTEELGFNLGNPLLGAAFYGGLIVDEHGKRFMNEYMLANESMAGGGEATLHVKQYYAIFGQRVIDALKEQGYYQIIDSPEFWVSGMLLYGQPLEDLDQSLQDAIDTGWVFKGDTIADVAAQAGLDELETTVEAYDDMAAAGVDTMFGKRAEMLIPVADGGPYYLFKYNPGAFNTFGGCRTDEFTRALRADFSPIECLYIAGVENGSLYSRPYYDVGGTCSGLAYSSGRLAGMQMAEYTS